MVTLQSTTEDRLWKALSDSKRRAILDHLKGGPKSTGDLVKLFPTIGRTGVMKHISVLQTAELIRVRREGSVRWNYWDAKQIEIHCSPWISHHISGIKSSISDLKMLAESETKTNQSRRR